jgi:hypothetical protein
MRPSLALDLYFQVNGEIPSKVAGGVRELSDLLRRLPYHVIAARKVSFRNLDGPRPAQRGRYAAEFRGER